MLRTALICGKTYFISSFTDFLSNICYCTQISDLFSIPGMQFADYAAAMESKGGNRCTIRRTTTTTKHALITCNSRPSLLLLPQCLGVDGVGCCHQCESALRFGASLELVGRPGHGDKIKLNCFMTADNRLDRRATVGGHSRKTQSVRVA